MTEKSRPNVVGKGPTLTREMLEVFQAIQANSQGLSQEAALLITSQLGERSAELEKIIKMAYLKTVKAGETAWDMKEKALELKDSMTAGDEAKSLEITKDLTAELDQLIHKTKTFVVRMT
ncbi:MAG: hypothetical protein HY879_04110 [Deltaproteobacteria bacterium]|nr:hypothetical protein [Deltaproteobacteria bacterium]